MRPLKVERRRGSAEPGRLSVVATIGPSSQAIVPDLLQAGADRLRLNTSHLPIGEVAEHVERIRAANAAVPLVLDLQGAKLRLGWFAARDCARQDRVRFEVEPTTDSVPLPHPEFFARIATSDTLSVDDGRLRFTVREHGSGWCVAEALAAGKLRSRRGVNVVEHPISLDDLTSADDRLCRYAAGLPHVELACSFMSDGREASWIRRRAPRARVIGKIERAEAVANLGLIGAAVDEIWVCRGDLGAQIGLAALARWVSGYRPSPEGPPVLIAGQVLEHLTEHPEPTRSEVCHLYDLLVRGFAGLVLSDETAIGRHPELAVRTVAGLLATFRE